MRRGRGRKARWSKENPLPVEVIFAAGILSRAWNKRDPLEETWYRFFEIHWTISRTPHPGKFGFFRQTRDTQTCKLKHKKGFASWGLESNRASPQWCLYTHICTHTHMHMHTHTCKDRNARRRTRTHTLSLSRSFTHKHTYARAIEKNNGYNIQSMVMCLLYFMSYVCHTSSYICNTQLFL